MVPVVKASRDFRRACQEARVDGPLALVPTMGFLHEGHASLIRAGRNLDTARDLLKRYLAATLSPDDPSRREAEKLLKQAGG